MKAEQECQLRLQRAFGEQTPIVLYKTGEEVLAPVLNMEEGVCRISSEEAALTEIRTFQEARRGEYILCWQATDRDDGGVLWEILTNREFLPNRVFVWGGTILNPDPVLPMDRKCDESLAKLWRRFLDLKDWTIVFSECEDGTLIEITRAQSRAKKIISMVSWRRPQYTRKVLEALEKCTGIEEFQILLHIDGGYPDRVSEMIEGMKNLNLDIVLNRHFKNIGCAANTYSALSHAFSKQRSGWVIHLEDDTLPSKDFLSFMEQCLDHYRDDENLFSVSGYHRVSGEEKEGITDEAMQTRAREIDFRMNFSCWGWGTWERVWSEVRSNWFGYKWRKIRALIFQMLTFQHRHHFRGKLFRNCVHSNWRGSWAHPMNAYWRGNRCEVAPRISRVQNIGIEDGTWATTPEFHKNRQETHVWMESSTSDFPIDLKLRRFTPPQ